MGGTIGKLNHIDDEDIVLYKVFVQPIQSSSKVSKFAKVSFAYNI
jgi:hypothetical protein